MIRLDLARGPRDLDLGYGVTVTALPLTSAVMMVAQASLPKDGTVQPFDLVRACGQLTIVGWTGVAGEDGAPAVVTPEAIGALLDLYPIGMAFQRLHVAPALVLDLEKNVSAPSPNGTSAGATDIAGHVPSAVPNAPMT